MSKTQPHVAIIGSALYGNQGAAAMLITSIQEISRKYPDAKFNLFSLYPKVDQSKNNLDNLTVTNARAVYLATVIIPLCILWRALPFLRNVISKNGSVKAFAEADVVLDQGGITFVDGRGLFLIYNVASLLPGLIMKKRTIKISQAMGPFKNSVNRSMAKIFLPKMYKILARGQQTAEYLSTLGLSNFETAADYSFLLEVKAAEKKVIDKLFVDRKIKGPKIIGISPSKVVDKKCQKIGIDYVQTLADLISWLDSQGYITLLIPHSIRHDGGSHNNDLPLCQSIIDKLPAVQNVHLINDDLSPAELRQLISRCSVFVASRFHAMVSSLAGSVPVIVVGWSHKYQEVIDMFKVDGVAITFDKLKVEYLRKMFDNVYSNRKKLHEIIQNNLPSVVKSAQQNTKMILEALES